MFVAYKYKKQKIYFSNNNFLDDDFPKILLSKQIFNKIKMSEQVLNHFTHTLYNKLAAKKRKSNQ